MDLIMQYIESCIIFINACDKSKIINFMKLDHLKFPFTEFFLSKLHENPFQLPRKSLFSNNCWKDAQRSLLTL